MAMAWPLQRQIFLQDRNNIGNTVVFLCNRKLLHKIDKYCYVESAKPIVCFVNNRAGLKFVPGSKLRWKRLL